MRPNQGCVHNRFDHQNVCHCRISNIYIVSYRHSAMCMHKKGIKIDSKTILHNAQTNYNNKFHLLLTDGHISTFDEMYSQSRSTPLHLVIR